VEKSTGGSVHFGVPGGSPTGIPVVLGVFACWIPGASSRSAPVPPAAIVPSESLFMPTSDSPFASRPNPISVVVADDVVEIQQLVQRWLTELGFLVTCVSSGEDAVRVLRTVHVDMVITDIIMPDGDGLELISELKRAQPSVRVIAMSGGGNHLRAVECLKFAQGLGAHGALMKPFNREQLLEMIGRQLSPGSAQSPGAR
jgi:CheY-like chemotaxis protein